jgi:MFS family permease
VTPVFADLAQADRNASVRAAARAWKGAGAIDGAALAAIEAAYLDDRHRVGPVFRVLLFFFTLISINGAVGFVWTLVGFATHSGGVLAGLALAAGAGLTVLTEILIARYRRAQGGIEAATSFAGLGYLIGFAGWVCFQKAGLKDEPGVAATLLVATLLLAGAAWRWGYPLYAAAATAAVLGSFAFVPGGRWGWIVLPLLFAPFLVRGSESARLPPAQRASCTAALGMALAGLYGAVNLVSYDQRWIELHDFGRRSGTAGGPRAFFIVATAIVPIIYLVLGLRSRRYVFLVLGAATGIASLATFRYYVHLAPLWAMLTASGALLMTAVFVLRRYLDSGPDKERHGFTAEPLFEDPGRRRLFEAGAAVLSLSPQARPLHEEPKFTGGGGEFGGGGASSDF